MMTTSPAYQRRTGICLNMIVKNETPVLDRLFRSLRGVIDYYVIVDTGSDDGTPEFIARWMGEAGIPGEVHRRPWVNFGANRDEALQLAVAAGRGDWLLFIDADEELACSDLAVFRQLTPGVSYQLEKRHAGLRYALNNLIDIRTNQWGWRAPVHEYLEHRGGPNLRKRLPAAWIVYRAGEGARSRGKTAAQKFLADAALLEAHLAQEPGDHRNRFYLAQSYRDAGQPDKAREHYLLRAAMPGGWIEETFCARFQAARMAQMLKLAHATVVGELLDAFNLRPCRAEPLYELAVICRHEKRWGEAYAFASAGAQLPKPDDQLFVQHDVYAWRLLDELAVAVYWAGFFAVSRDAGQQILNRHAADADADHLQIPANALQRIHRNLHLTQEKLPHG